jgi:hypothetical protein
MSPIASVAISRKGGDKCCDKLSGQCMYDVEYIATDAPSRAYTMFTLDFRLAHPCRQEHSLHLRLQRQRSLLDPRGIIRISRRTHTHTPIPLFVLYLFAKTQLVNGLCVIQHNQHFA